MKSYILDITLDGTEPAVRRKVAIPSDSSFFDLHRVIQDCMGWMDIHIHEFVVGKDRTLIGPAALKDVQDEREVALSDHIRKKIHYTYDFGDFWEVTVSYAGKSEDYLIPKLLEFEEEAPVDDAGGLEGFKRIKGILADPSDPDHERVREWMKSFPPRSRQFVEFSIATYLYSGVRNGRRGVNPLTIGAMTEVFTVPHTGDLYVDVENGKVCELVDSVKQKSRLGKVTEKLIESDPERYAAITVSYDDLDAMAESMAKEFGVEKKIRIADGASLLSLSKDDRTEWLTYSISYYAKQVLDSVGLYIDYGYVELPVTEIKFREMRKDPEKLMSVLRELDTSQ